ncbi:MAG: magnesium/cobalt transporter CorA [Promethearchaeota archaeon]
MPELIKNISKKKGLPPGTLLYIGDEIHKKTKISATSYTKEKFLHEVNINLDEVKLLLNDSDIKWINIMGISDADVIEKIGSIINLHQLLLEDIMNTEQRPKIVIMDSGIFLILKNLNYSSDDDKLTREQIGLILGKNHIICFKERENDIFNAIELRIQENIGLLRTSKSDYLLYSLLDIIVDNYLMILEEIAEKIEKTEKELISNPTEITLHKILRLKRNINIILKNALPLKEILNRLIISKSEYIQENTILYINDIQDHVLYIIETVETFQNMLFEMLNVYLSSVNNKLNEVMKVLTIISTIFIPITFITGFFGMNLTFLPWINEIWAPIILITIMLSMGIIMIIYFKKKKWF